MWKGLISRVFAREVSKMLEPDRNIEKQLSITEVKKMAEDYRKLLINEYNIDYEKQQEVAANDVELEYLISINKICNDCILLLNDPFERVSFIDIIAEQINELAPKTLKFMDNLELENDFFQQRMLDLVAPYLDLTKVLFNNEEDLKGIVGYLILHLDSGSEVVESLEVVLNDFINIMMEIKLKIKEAFIEIKQFQIVSYSAVGEVGEIDFGKYTVEYLI